MKYVIPLIIGGLVIVASSCDNNPFYPKAEVRVTKVNPENQKLKVTYQLTYVLDQFGNLVRVDTALTYDIQPVAITFSELYGGRWADIQHYHILYTSVTTNFGDTLNFGPLDGGFNLYIPPSGEATANLWTVTFDIIDQCARSFIDYEGGLTDSLIVTFNEQIDFDGKDELDNDIHWHIPHSTVVYYDFEVEYVQEGAK